MDKILVGMLLMGSFGLGKLHHHKTAKSKVKTKTVYKYKTVDRAYRVKCEANKGILKQCLEFQTSCNNKIFSAKFDMQVEVDKVNSQLNACEDKLKKAHEELASYPHPNLYPERNDKGPCDFDDGDPNCTPEIDDKVQDSADSMLREVNENR